MSQPLPENPWVLPPFTVTVPSMVRLDCPASLKTFPLKPIVNVALSNSMTSPDNKLVGDRIVSAPWTTNRDLKIRAFFNAVSRPDPSSAAPFEPTKTTGAAVGSGGGSVARGKGGLVPDIYPSGPLNRLPDTDGARGSDVVPSLVGGKRGARRSSWAVIGLISDCFRGRA